MVSSMVRALPDMGDRMVADEQLRRSEARLSTILEHLREGLIIATLDGDVFYWNPAALTMHGFTNADECHRLADQFRRQFELWTPDRRRKLPYHEWPLVRVMRGEHVHEVELCLRRLDQGWERSILYSGVIAETLTGEKLAHLSMIDLSEQRRAEAALRKSEGLLRLFIEHAPAGIAMFDREMRYLAVSRRWREDYQLQGELIGRSHYDIFPEIPERWKEVHRRVLAGEILKADEDPFVRPNGTTQWIRWEVRPWYDQAGEIGGALIAAEDVTARVRAQQALTEQRRVLKSVTDTATVALFIMDQQGQCTFMNPAAEKLTGYRLHEVQGKSMHSLIHHTRPDGTHYPKEECPIVRARPENTKVQGEDVFIHKEGHFYEVAFIASPIREPSGQAIGTVVEVRDITQEKKAAHILRESEIRHRQLAEALGEADRRKDEYLAMLAHELRNPLAPMHNAAQILQRLGSSDPRIVRAADIVARQVGHMARLVDDLLDVSRMARGKISLQKTRLDMTELVRHVAEDHRTAIEGAQLRFHVSLPDCSLFVMGDKTLLAQVFTNLLQNALKFTPPGGDISFDVQRENQEIVLRVKDTGIGMTPDLLQHLFEPFVQADSSLDRSKGGLGLGLALAKGIVQLHGGQIAAYSEGKGTGSTIEVRLALLKDDCR
jgi:PAS domain S-box-containing protein